MTKVIFVWATLIGVALFTNQATAARHDVGARHVTAKAHNATGCVRAPSVGAFDSDPYTLPPCMPNTAVDMVQ